MDVKIPTWQRRDDLFIVPPAGWLLVSVALLSVFLAGGRPLWAQGILALGVALLWLRHTPERLPSRGVVIMLAVLALTPLAAYFPGSWAGLPSWREGLLEHKAITPSYFITPQPWLTFHVYFLWLTGVALAAWCACQEWDHYNRGTLARMYAGGLLAITLFALFGAATGYQPSWWVSTDGFGPFLNRNQWGAAMGFGTIICFTLIHQCVRQEYKQGAIFWLLAALVFIGSIVFNGSRGGFVIAILGGFAYWGSYGLLRKQYRYAAIGLSFLLISFVLLALGGGALLERFVGLHELLEGETGKDFRVQFYRMTMALISGSPLAGFGLGNFEYVFPFYLDHEPMFDRRPVHPESSWLWLASEGGWLLLTVVATSLVVLFLRAFSARKSRAATIRAAALACASMLAFSSGFDVNGHRLGTLFPVILLASLALPPAKGVKLSGPARTLAKSIGALLAFAGFLWLLGGSFHVALFPAMQGVSPLQARADAAEEAGETAQALAKLEKCQSLRPLDWNIHWTLSDWLLQQNEVEKAWQEFRAANALLPYLYWTIQKRAEQWIPVSPGRAAAAVLEAMYRAPERRRAEIYGAFLNKSSSNPPLRSMLMRLFPADTELEFIRIKQSPPGIAEKRLARLIHNTDDLSAAPDHLVPPILRFLLERNQQGEIDRISAGSTRIKRLAWDVLMDRALRDKQTKEAMEIYFEYAPKPVLPAPLNRSDLRSIERAAALAPMDIATSIAYYQALIAAQRNDDALWQLRCIMELPNAPDYIWYLAAQQAHRSENHEESLKFLRAYEEKVRATQERKSTREAKPKRPIP